MRLENKAKARPCTTLLAMPYILKTIPKQNNSPCPPPPNSEGLLYKIEETSQKLEKEIKNIVKNFSKIEESIGVPEITVTITEKKSKILQEKSQ